MRQRLEIFGKGIRTAIFKDSSYEIFPGLGLAAALTGGALLLEQAQSALTGSVFLDGIVLAILLGTGFHTMFGLPPALQPGVRFAAKRLLELAILLLGASISLSALAGTGAVMAAAVAGMVVLSLLFSYGIGRGFGLPHRLAILVACGNSICGNSAIMAAAPAIKASQQDVTASIAFTAALGIIVVLMLPLSFACLGISPAQYGVLAGMTVYAVPQVLAATLPVAQVSLQIGTLVKLMRVLMLGPVVLGLGLMQNGRSGDIQRPPLMPWFILGFLALMAARSFDLLPAALLAPLHGLSTALTTLSMAALGLSVNLRAILSSGGRVLAAGSLSIAGLAGLSLLAVHFLPGL
ncbi:YeiH family protein [Rhizobium paknamense]|uniref:Integral membrane protein (TIGR00698 family) n=1 Tax=Rhizobium paknamense TaxID=1206817 RepID=A0ABU0IC87_9HYPH|nr:putative sulfate exporter family transporter [Rhizobium paknamense]MDQ0455850.1 putative integral membrane protein (TIGR00698 family) [Rhizobium paknamense]